MASDRPRPGIHLVHKPAGPTSFTLVQELQRELALTPGRRLPSCHGGTLDPFAEGLLLLLVGPATQLFELLHEVPKVYEAELRFGAETDTGDPGGHVVAQGEPAALTPEAIAEACEAFVGFSEQVPPQTSARRVGGERAYVRAHRGESFELPPSRVYLHRVELVSHALPGRATLRLTVRGGYYVRAFARDLGRRLGARAHLGRLWRSAIGPWSDPGLAQAGLVTGRAVLPWARARTLCDLEVGQLRQGRPIAAGTLEPAPWTVPDGFPPPTARVLGLHQGAVRFVLEPAADTLVLRTELRGAL